MDGVNGCHLANSLLFFCCSFYLCCTIEVDECWRRTASPLLLTNVWTFINVDRSTEEEEEVFEHFSSNCGEFRDPLRTVLLLLIMSSTLEDQFAKRKGTRGDVCALFTN